MFINYEQVIQLIRNEANYAASILSNCKPCVFVNGKENDAISVMVKFSRMNFYQCFQFVINRNEKRLYDEIKMDFECSCKKAILRLVYESYGKENIIERSEESE